MSLVVLDIGVGNTASMMWALERLGARPALSADPERVADAGRLILPGVGSADHAMARLDQLGLVSTLKAFDRPVLGICLGMQLLMTSSQEGEVDCLDRISGRVERLEASPDRPVPHMGWNQIERLVTDDPLLDGLNHGDYVYFVHGFAAPIGAATIARTDYGAPFSAMVRQDRVWGCQFHPERSGPTGARILRNFVDLPC